MTNKTKTATKSAPAPAELTDAHTLTARATVEMTIGNHITNAAFDSVVVSVEKYTPKLFKVYTDDLETLNNKSVESALQEFISEDAGIAMKKGKNDFTYPDIEWAEVKNQKEDKSEIELNADDQLELDSLTKTIVDLITVSTSLNADKRANALELGRDLHRAKQLMSRENDAGERINVASAAWGRWQAVNLPITASFKGKNAVSEHIDCATLPAAVMQLMPVTKLSAKSMVTWARGCRNAAAKAVTETALSNLTDAQHAAIVGFEGEITSSKLGADIKAFVTAVDAALDALAAQHDACVEDVNYVPRKDGDTAVDEAMLLEQEALAMRVAGASYSFGELAKAIMKEVKSQSVKAPTAKEEAEKDADKYADDTSAVARGFADFTVDEAAEHIAKIVLARDDWADVLEAANDKATMLLASREQAEEDVADNEGDEA